MIRESASLMLLEKAAEMATILANCGIDVGIAVTPQMHSWMVSEALCQGVLEKFYYYNGSQNVVRFRGFDIYMIEQTTGIEIYDARPIVLHEQYGVGVRCYQPGMLVVSGGSVFVVEHSASKNELKLKDTGFCINTGAHSLQRMFVSAMPGKALLGKLPKRRNVIVTRRSDGEFEPTPGLDEMLIGMTERKE